MCVVLSRACRYWLGDLSARFLVTLGAKNNVLQRTKAHHMQRTYPLLTFIGVAVPPSSQPFAPMTQALPDNVELLSLNTQYEQVGHAHAFHSPVIDPPIPGVHSPASAPLVRGR